MNFLSINNWWWQKLVRNNLPLLIIVALLLPQLSLAQSMSSSNYVIQTDIINVGGGQSTSASYGSNSKIGKLELNYVVTGVPDDDGSGSGGVSTVGGGIISQILNETPQNVSNFTATALTNSIRLNWRNPNSGNFDRVRVVRSTTFFPTSPDEGEIVYQGTGTGYNDTAVVVGVRYFYTAFSFYQNNDHSSGAVAAAIILKPGQVPPVPGLDLPVIPTADPVIGSLTLRDFDFIQAGGLSPVVGELVVIDGDSPLLISLAYDKVPEVLKSIAVTLYDPQDRNKSFSFLLRVNKDKTAYQAHIGALGRSGNYALEITILDFDNKGIKKISGALVASISSAFSDLPPIFSSLWLLILILLFLIYLSYRSYRYYKQRSSQRQSQRITFSDNYHV